MVVLLAAATGVASADSNDAEKVGQAVAAATAGMAVVPARADADAALVHEGDAARVIVPRNPADGVSFSGSAGALKVGLPVTRSAGAAVGTSAGTVVYPDASSTADVAVQSIADGARILVTLDDASAPREYRFPLTLPPGAKITPKGDASGELEITTDQDGTTVVIGNVAAPWAKDAAGAAVKTRYRLDGTTIVQVLEPAADAAYPIVADPSVSAGWVIYVRYKKNEVRDKLDYVSNQSMFAAFLCAPVARLTALGAALCAGGLGTSYSGLASEWRSAYHEGKCMEVKWSYVLPFPWGYRRYSC